VTLQDLAEFPRAVALLASTGDSKALEAYLAGLPKDLAPRTLRRLFERLGATYVKLGQFIASSPTLFPPEYVLEFQKCLDSTPTVGFEVVKRIVEEDLGRPIDDLFASFDKEPLASASIAQVHGAVLKSTGARVVVKVQKPQVAGTLKADLGFIAAASKILEFLSPGLGRLSLANVAADLRQSMLGELDFTQEAQNLREFRAFLEESGLTGVATAPAPFEEFSSAKVLTMDRLYGVPLSDLDGIKGYSSNPEQTLVDALNVWTLSVVACPFFHADVHAGNLLVLEDGRVGFIDFGIVGRIPPTIWGALNALAASLVGAGGEAQGGASGASGLSPDFDGMARALTEMGATSDDVDVGRFASDLRSLFGRLDAITPTVTAALGEDGTVLGAALGVDDLQVTELALELVGVADRNGVRLPREFGILLKQVLYFDRYTRLLAPDLDLLTDQRLEALQQSQQSKTDPREGAIDV